MDCPPFGFSSAEIYRNYCKVWHLAKTASMFQKTPPPYRSAHPCPQILECTMLILEPCKPEKRPVWKAYIPAWLVNRPPAVILIWPKWHQNWPKHTWCLTKVYYKPGGQGCRRHSVGEYRVQRVKGIFIISVICTICLIVHMDDHTSRLRPPSTTVVSAQPFPQSTLHKAIVVHAGRNGANRHWFVSLWRDPNDVCYCWFLPTDKAEWCPVPTALCRQWRRHTADHVWQSTKHVLKKERRQIHCDKSITRTPQTGSAAQLWH